MDLRKMLPALEATIVWLFLLQAFRALFASLFGVIYDAVFDQTLSILVVGLDLLLVIVAISTPLLLGLFRVRAGPSLLAVLLVLATRIPMSSGQPGLRLYSAILLVGSAAFYVAYWLWRQPQRLLSGFLAGLGADQLMRAFDYTYDPTLRPEGLPIVIGVALITAAFAVVSNRQPGTMSQDRPHLTAGVVLGAGLFIQTTILALPNALTQWSDLDYHWAAVLLLPATLLPLVPAVRGLAWYLTTWLWPLGSVLSVATILLCFILAALFGGSAAAPLLLTMQFLFLLKLSGGVVKKRVAERQRDWPPGLGVSLGFIVFIVLNFAFAFTFTYPYTVPFFRGLGTPILTLGIFTALLPLVKVPLAPEMGGADLSASALSLTGVVVLAVICFYLSQPPELLRKPAQGPLRLATYNIHYGFDSDWVYNLEHIAETIERDRVDVVMLQEVDAARITSYGVDDALWLGQRLGMHEVFQPTLEKLSGIALLSRYPLDAYGGEWLSSAFEQTAIVYGAVKTQRGPLYAYGLWLGLEPDERAVQLEEALDFIGGENPVALGGDFNATPDSPIYARIREAGLEDPYLLTGDDPAPTSPAVDPSERIDYVWLRGLTPQKAWVSDSVASDHRMAVVEVQ